MSALQQASELFTLFKRLKSERAEREKATGKETDPNFYALALTQANPKFANAWPIVIKTMVLRAQFYSAAFEAYERYCDKTSVDSLASKRLDELDPKVKRAREARAAYKKAVEAAPAEVITTHEVFAMDATEVKLRREAGEVVEPISSEVITSRPAAEIPEPPSYDAPPETLLEAKLLGRAEHASYYVYLTILEDVKRERPHDWKKHIPSGLRQKLEQDVLQELKATEQENEEARQLAEQKRLEAMAEYRRHVCEWLARASQIEDYDPVALVQPNPMATGARADVMEFKQNFDHLVSLRSAQ